MLDNVLFRVRSIYRICKWWFKHNRHIGWGFWAYEKDGEQLKSSDAKKILEMMTCIENCDDWCPFCEAMRMGAQALEGEREARYEKLEDFRKNNR